MGSHLHANDDHDHHHEHGHGDHHGHGHGHIHAHDERRLLLALLLTVAFMVVEAVGGVLAGSLALLADAGHMLTDAAALGMSLLAFRLAQRPASWEKTYGYARIEILAALVNGVVLVVTAVAIAWEAWRRLA